MNLKVCFCGLGSIGKRHLNNLTRLALEFGLSLEIQALRKTEAALDDNLRRLITKQVTQVTDLDWDYDIAFITNPTSLHYETLKLMAKRAKHIFIEKPIFDDKVLDFSTISLSPKGVYYVAGPLRYSPVVARLKEIVECQKVYSVRAICSSYLPNWRPNSDYRQVYSAKKELGGGVDIDLIHEWDYLIALFGFPKKVYRICKKYSNLEIDTADIAAYIGEYDNMLIELHLDYFGRETRRQIELFTESTTIVGDLNNNIITFSDSREPIQFDEDDNDIYLREMQFFLGCIQSKQPFNNMRRCYSVLDVALGRNRL